MRFRYAIAVLLLLASRADAHPLATVQFDRTVAVRLSSEGIEVNYRLELSPLALFLDSGKRLSPDEIAALDKSERKLVAAYAKSVVPELTDKFRVTVNGEALALRVASIETTIADHARCDFKLRAAWPPGGRERTVAVNDETFADKPGTLRLTLDQKDEPTQGVELVDVEEPPARLRDVPPAKLTPADVALMRRASAVVKLPAAIAPHAPTHVQPSPAIEAAPEPTVNADQLAPNLATDLYQRGLPALFNSSLGIGVLLLAAFLFGAAHAFTPGHGKTLVAAYLVGERGTVRHAVILAVATTVAHTGSVIAVAAILWSVYGNDVPAAAQGTLQFVAGMLVIAVGLWLLLRRVTGQADHFHLFAGDHHHHHHESGVGSRGSGVSHAHNGQHHHHHGPTPESAKTTAGWTRLLLMGLGGGLVPCWDAVLLLVAASAMGRLGFALPLLFAFSLGLGAVLVALGVAVVYAHRAGATRFKDHRWFRWLPVVSAVLLVGIGFWLCKQAVGIAAN